MEENKGELAVTNKSILFLQKPYFYTLQDHIPTKEKQLRLWSQFLYKYLLKNKIQEFSVSKLEADDFILFNNKAINRRLDKEMIVEVLKTLSGLKKIEFKNESMDVFFVHHRSPADLAEEIYKWARRAGRIKKVCTVVELTSHEDLREESFWGMPEDLLMVSLKELEKSRRAEIIYLGDTGNINEVGIKFC